MPPTANVRSVDQTEWEFVYPAPTDLAPELQLEKRHVVLAFAEPVAIDRVRVRGSKLESAELVITTVEPESGIERKEHDRLGYRIGGDLTWHLRRLARAERVNTLKIAAELAPDATDSSSRSLRLAIEFKANPIRP